MTKGNEWVREPIPAVITADKSMHAMSLPAPRMMGEVRNHMKTKGEFDFRAQPSIGDHVLNVLFVLVRRF